MTPLRLMQKLKLTPINEYKLRLGNSLIHMHPDYINPYLALALFLAALIYAAARHFPEQ